MNSSEIIWLVVGTAAGYLLGTLATVWLLRIRVREVKGLHPMQYVMANAPSTPAPTTTFSAPENDDLGWTTLTTLAGDEMHVSSTGDIMTSSTSGTPEAFIDWDAGVREELAVVPPKPRFGPAPTTVTEPCPICGRYMKQGFGMRQHTRIKHPAPVAKPRRRKAVA